MRSCKPSKLTRIDSAMILAGAYIWIIKQYGELTLLDHIPW